MTYESRELSTYSGAPVECYKFGRAGAAFRFTDADRVTTIPDGTFEPTVIRRTTIAQNQENTSGSTEVTMDRADPFVAQFVPYLPTATITLVIFRSHRGEADVKVAFNGEVTASRFVGSECVLTCMPLSYRMQKRIPSTSHQSKCNHALYGPFCTVNKALFKLAGAVAAIAGATVEVAVFATQPDQWLRNGWIERDSDLDRRFIINHAGAVITLDAPFADLAPGQLVSAYAGCERTEAVCTTKFNNLVHHLGWARVPTKNPFDGITEWVTGTAINTPSPPRFRAG